MTALIENGPLGLNAALGELAVLSRITGVRRLARRAGRITQQAELQHLQAPELAEGVGVRQTQQGYPVASGIGDQDRARDSLGFVLRPRHSAEAGQEREHQGTDAAHEV